MIRTRRSSAQGAAGQALVLMVGGILAVVAMVALIVDGGNAWAQQRVVQNGSDATAEAGTIVMAQRFAGATAPGLGWDAEVSSKIQASAAANGLTVTAAYYTDICGIPLRKDGTAALNLDGTENLAGSAGPPVIPPAAQVGTPDGSALLAATPTNTAPDCPSYRVGPPAGVKVFGHKNVGTYFAGAIGITTLGVTTQATAVAGYLQGYCDATTGEACAVLPVTIPVDIVSCDGSNNAENTGVAWNLGQVYKVPLCKNNPGNVGWLDWTPPNGGTSELIQSVLHPNNPAIDLPSWQFVTSTGDPNSKPLEDALRTYDGQIVMIPQFDQTCGLGPHDTVDQSQVSNSAAHYGCLNATTNDLGGGNGQNEWYRVPSFAFFQLCSFDDSNCTAHGAYINGSNKAECDSGNGATSCLVGRFVSILSTGTVGPGVGGGTTNTKAIGVQLIK